MSKGFRFCIILLMLMACGFFYRNTSKQPSTIFKSIISPGSKNSSSSSTYSATNVSFSPISSMDVLKKGNGIIFIETTDRMNPPSLVLCAIESAARVYKDRSVVFFMKGLSDINTMEDELKARNHFPTLSSFDNVYFFPLQMEKLFNDTPLMPWYKKHFFGYFDHRIGYFDLRLRLRLRLERFELKIIRLFDHSIVEVNPIFERYWTHVSSDGCRLALIWKHGGIYMDSDIISMQPIPDLNFLEAQSSQYSSNGVFGLMTHHTFPGKAWKTLCRIIMGQYGGNRAGSTTFYSHFKDILCHSSYCPTTYGALKRNGTIHA
ncbi:hypothetical protein XELAEV_18030000mg [Xenopus laevis]|uniref:Alpha-1,4-N-acetylglucosaminyltransferase n=1 Tax=Xenopus laevis TaxID=8355 RepID=A0A974CUC5_XENLA|nr:hypothetical protein XELAEV_18030000mg [Xenopus laevis]